MVGMISGCLPSLREGIAFDAVRGILLKTTSLKAWYAPPQENSFVCPKGKTRQFIAFYQINLLCRSDFFQTVSTTFASTIVAYFSASYVAEYCTKNVFNHTRKVLEYKIAV